MKAFHPECGGEGCADCDEGFVEVTIALGTVLAKRCPNGCPGGGRIVGEGIPPPPSRPEPCSFCGAQRDWLIAGTIGEKERDMLERDAT